RAIGRHFAQAIQVELTPVSLQGLDVLVLGCELVADEVLRHHVGNVRGGMRLHPGQGRDEGVNDALRFFLVVLQPVRPNQNARRRIVAAEPFLHALTGRQVDRRISDLQLLERIDRRLAGNAANGLLELERRYHRLAGTSADLGVVLRGETCAGRDVAYKIISARADVGNANAFAFPVRGRFHVRVRPAHDPLTGSDGELDDVDDVLAL